MKTIIKDPLLTPGEVAKQLGVTVRTLRTWRAEGRLEVIRLGHRTVRIKKSQLDKLLQQRANLSD